MFLAYKESGLDCEQSNQPRLRRSRSRVELKTDSEEFPTWKVFSCLKSRTKDFAVFQLIFDYDREHDGLKVHRQHFVDIPELRFWYLYQ